MERVEMGYGNGLLAFEYVKSCSEKEGNGLFFVSMEQHKQ